MRSKRPSSAIVNNAASRGMREGSDRAFIVPLRAEWERHRITALSGQDDFRLTRDRLVAALSSRHDAVLLLSVEGAPIEALRDTLETDLGMALG